MRLYQQIRASIARSVVVGAGALLFASGMPVSASGQAPQTPQLPEPTSTTLVSRQTIDSPPSEVVLSVRNGTAVSMEDAVRMALENNMGIQEETLNPEIQSYAVERAHLAYAPAIISSLSRSNSSAPPTDFLSSGVAVVTNGNLFSQAGIQQQTKWGGNYTVTMDGSRGTSDAPHTTYPLSLQSHMSGVVNQPLLRNFKMDALREQIQLSRAQLKVADLGLQQRITQTSRSVRAAYYNLVGAISGLDVAQQSLDLSRQSLKDNQVRLEVGTIPSIDLVSSEAEVAANEEAVIIQEAAIGTAEDQFRTLIMNPSQPAFWTTTFRPTDQPSLTPHAIDVDAAVKNALANRTDILQFKKQIEGTDIGIRFAQNQRLPEVDLQGRYGVTGIGGQQIDFGTDINGSPIVVGQSNRGFSDVLRDVFGNNFRTWSFALNVSYPIGMSQADAALAQGRVQRKQQGTQLTDLEVQVTAAVRDAGRQVNANLKRVEADTKARELAKQKLDAEQKRFAVGLSSTFELFQAQRDLASARQRELGAIIAYNQSLVDFETVQIAPLR